jgi:osmotically-inducible protein OsmY
VFARDQGTAQKHSAEQPDQDPIPRDRQGHIYKVFRRNAELESSGITVSVEGGKITLSGWVKALHERRIAEDAVWGVASVTEVVDNLIVA